MAKLTLLFAAIFISYAQCAVLNIEDGALKRTVRSPCYACGGKADFPPPPPPIIPPPPPPVIPPPPPPVLRTENWSGLARSADGLQNTVFSGAAAAAKQGAQASGEAFSLASSTVNGVTTGLSNGQPGYGEAASLGGSIGIKHEISSGINGNGHISKGHGYGDYSGGNFKEAHSYHSDNGKYNGNDESQLSNSNGPSFGSASLSDQNAKIAGGIEYQGFGRGITAESSSNGHFDKYHNGDVQQVQARGFGAGSGTQNGYLSQNGASSGGVGYNNYNHGVSGGHSYEQHGGRDLADAQRNQQVYDTSSSSQSGAFGRNIGSSSHGGNGGHFESQRGSFGDQQSSQGLQYGSTHSGGDSIGQLQSNGYGSSPSSQSRALDRNIDGSSHGENGGHYENQRGSFGDQQSSQGLQYGSAHSGGDSIAQLHSNGYGSSPSSQSGAFDRNIDGSGHSGNGGHYESQRGSFGDQQSSQGLQYGSAHSGGDSIAQLHSNGYGSSPSSQSGAFSRNIGGSGHGGYGGHYKSGRSTFGDRESSQEELQNGSAHSGGDSIAQIHSSGYGSSSQGEIEKTGHTELQSTGQAHFVQGDSGLQAGVSGSLPGDAQSALSGALNLASQGVQASQASSGCSTCGKSSYALSNAKSHSGSAVAVSIGG